MIIDIPDFESNYLLKLNYKWRIVADETTKINFVGTIMDTNVNTGSYVINHRLPDNTKADSGWVDRSVGLYNNNMCDQDKIKIKFTLANVRNVDNNLKLYLDDIKLIQTDRKLVHAGCD